MKSNEMLSAKIASEGFRLIEAILPKADSLPFSFHVGDRLIYGIPKDWNRRTETVSDTAEKTVMNYIGNDPVSGIEVRMEATVWHDFPSVEWVVWLTNKSFFRTPLITNLLGADIHFMGKNPVLKHCNGDGVGEISYKEEYLPLPNGEKAEITPAGGRPSSEAFPYFTLLFENYGYHAIVGWSGEWKANFEGTEQGVRFTDKQYHTNFKLDPGETVRTPLTLILVFNGNEERGINVWRRYYLAHIMPHPYAGFPEPIMFCHESDNPGAEWTGATEEGQVKMIQSFLNRGIHFNGWWIDAGWFRCDGDWGNTGTWVPDPERFPKRMKPIGEICAKNNIRFLLWFEPERLRLVSRDPEMKDEWLFDWVRINGDGKEDISEQYLLNLGNEECRNWITNKVDKVIKEAGVRIFRSDFNILPWGHWTANEIWNRRGINENKYIQGYLEFWKEITRRNPGIMIDACASGGQRNDLETMRLSVPLQYTDCGIGANEPFKCAFSRTMFMWLPYFRQHLGYWGGGMDNYSYHLAIVPSVTYLMPHDAPQETVDYVTKMDAIRDKAARMMLRDDYYALAPDTRLTNGYYAVQFHDEMTGEGLVHIIRHCDNTDDTVTVFPKAFGENTEYLFTSPEFGKEIIISGKEIAEKGFSVSIPKRSGEIWFYRVK